MSFIYFYVYQNYFILLMGWIFYFFIAFFVVKHINQIAFFIEYLFVKVFYLAVYAE